MTSKKIFVFFLDATGVALLLGGVGLDLFTRPEQYSLGTLQIAISVAGFVLTLGASFLLSSDEWRGGLAPRFPSLTTFAVSLLLLVLNLTGVLIPLRNPAVYEGIEYGGKIRVVQYAAEEVYRQMNRIAAIDEQYPEYVKRLTQLIFDGTVHYWEENDPGDPFNLRIRPRENYLIYLLSKLRGENSNYEFCRAERAIERSVSVCSQASKILADILKRNRVKAGIVGLDGHVVVRARVDKETDTWWLLDADYGVVIEHDIDEVEANPDLISEAYQQAGYSESVIETLIEVYGAEGNEIIDENPECGEEDYLYLLKWLFPVLGLLPFSMFTLLALGRKQ